MKKYLIIIGLALVAIVTSFLALGTTTAAARPLKLVIKGADGQKFKGFYVADGITNSVSAVAPTTLNFEARNVNFEFRREGGVGEFRVELYVNDQCRTSTISDKQKCVRGVLKYTKYSESYSAEGF
jgi:hypothetical protein